MKVDITEINSNRVQGYQLIPEARSNNTTVITFGGSDGNCWLNMGHDIARKGYTVLSLFYFGKANLPQSLSKVNLSFFDDVIGYIKKNPDLPNTITIVGASRGAELALLLATEYELVSNVILFSPSAFVFAGINHSSSAWVNGNKELPFITFSFRTIFQRFLNRKLPLEHSFRRELRHTKLFEQARIDISEFSGNIVMFAGREDLTWPSSEMGELIKSNASSASSVELFSFENAGHSFSNAHYDGGDSDGNLFAYYKSQRIIEESLLAWGKESGK